MSRGTQAPEWWQALTEHHAHIGAALGDLSKVLRKMNPAVLSVQTYVLDSTGTAAGQYRLPYGCLTVDNLGTHQLTVANSPLTEQPTAGPGVAFVRAGGFSVLNLSGYSFSIYGGQAGDLVTVTAYGGPQQPYAR